LEELSGLDLLKKLLESIRGYTPAETTVREPALERDVPCQVADCRSPSVFRCSAGWRFCANHAKLHGLRGEGHSFELIANRTLEQIRDAETRMGQRVDAGEGHDEYL
jgi:hypothetical protein